MKSEKYRKSQTSTVNTKIQFLNCFEWKNVYVIRKYNLVNVIYTNTIISQFSWVAGYLKHSNETPTSI